MYVIIIDLYINFVHMSTQSSIYVAGQLKENSSLIPRLSLSLAGTALEWG